MVLRYLRDELGYKSDLRYQGPFGGGYPPPNAFRGDWMSPAVEPQVGETVGAPAHARNRFDNAMRVNPSLRVLSACGIYDLVCDYYGNQWTASQSRAGISEQRRHPRSYPGGHAMYTDPRAHMMLKARCRAFIRERCDPGAQAVRCGPLVRLACAVAVLLVAPMAAALHRPTPCPASRTPIVTTRHRITLNGKPLAYTARAGSAPDSTQRHRRTAWLHLLRRVHGRSRARRSLARPLTFAWNGGPGSNALLLHLDALGPRRLNAGDCRRAGQHAAFEDNQATWLDATDLVFVDPIGTGFSRPARPEYADDFYGVLGDIAATVEFIRAYRTRFDALGRAAVSRGRELWRLARRRRRRGDGEGGAAGRGAGADLGRHSARARRRRRDANRAVRTDANGVRVLPQKLPAGSQADRDRAVSGIGTMGARGLRSCAGSA